MNLNNFLSLESEAVGERETPEFVRNLAMESLLHPILGVEDCLCTT
jgi:hypothetical protein